MSLRKKKAFALVSVGLGHLDFGGMGYLRLVQGLRDQGVEISWLTYGKAMARKLGQIGEPYRMLMSLQSLWTPGANHIFSKKDTVNKDLLMQLKHFELFLKFEKPDFILIDRILPFAATIAKHLGIDHYVIGSPGGQWKITDYSVTPGEIIDKKSLAPMLSKRLHYDLDSLNAFASSDSLNITFLPREFYDSSQINGTSRFVNLFPESSTEPESRARTSEVGVSFGNTEFKGFLMDLLPQIMDYHGEPNVRIYCPKRHKSYTRLKKSGYSFEEWGDFHEELPQLSLLYYFGGISTTWYCMNYNLPMAVTSSQLDDQDFNAHQISKREIGVALSPNVNLAKMLGTIDLQRCTQRIEEIKKDHQFTDDLESIITNIL